MKMGYMAMHLEEILHPGQQTTCSYQWLGSRGSMTFIGGL